jgi:hypothetical protein
MKRMPAFLVVGVAAVSLLLGVASPAAASSITLDDPVVLASLLCGGSITVGDKLFDEFSYSSTGDMPKAHKVKVIPIQDSDGNFGVRFQGGFVDFYGDGPSDALITYRVTVLDPLFLISDVHLAGNPDVIGKDCHKSYKCEQSGLIGVTETFFVGRSVHRIIHLRCPARLPAAVGLGAAYRTGADAPRPERHRGAGRPPRHRRDAVVRGPDLFASGRAGTFDDQTADHRNRPDLGAAAEITARRLKRAAGAPPRASSLALRPGLPARLNFQSENKHSACAVLAPLAAITG